MKKKYLEAGEIVNTHGVRGNVKIYPRAADADMLRTFKTLYMGKNGEKPVKVKSAYVHKGCVIAALEGVDDVNTAMCLKGKVLYFDREDAGLEEGEFFLDDIIGARVVTEDGAEVGTLTEVLQNPTQDVYIIQGETEHLIPAVDEFILDVDVDNERITVRMIEGM